MANHTPGPWTTHGRQIRAQIQGREVAIAAAKLYIGLHSSSLAATVADDEQAAANARLIAAAPDLLAVATELRDALVEYGAYTASQGCMPWIDPLGLLLRRLNAAIDKATGEGSS